MTTPQTIRVKVTKKHIAKGIKENAFNCPVALSVAAKLRVLGVAIRTDGSMVGQHYYKLSPATLKFISNFDSDLPVKPFTAVLRREK